jgi:inward rectifier potassium channel
VRGQLPILPLAWTLMHQIDDTSPLFGMDSAAMIAAQARLFVSIEARDPSLSAVVYDLRNFRPEDVAFGMRYTDALTTSDDGATVLDMSLISAMEPDTPTHTGIGGLL